MVTNNLATKRDIKELEVKIETIDLKGCLTSPANAASMVVRLVRL